MIDNAIDEWNPTFGVSFVDTNTGTVVGQDGIILRTTDGGNTWTVQFSGTGYSFQAVSFIDADSGIAVGNRPFFEPLIVRSTNGGTTWTTQSSPASQPFNAVSFVDANTAIAVGDVGTIVRTTTGGD